MKSYYFYDIYHDIPIYYDLTFLPIPALCSGRSAIATASWSSTGNDQTVFLTPSSWQQRQCINTWLWMTCRNWRTVHTTCSSISVGKRVGSISQNSQNRLQRFYMFCLPKCHTQKSCPKTTQSSATTRHLWQQGCVPTIWALLGWLSPTLFVAVILCWVHATGAGFSCHLASNALPQNTTYFDVCNLWSSCSWMASKTSKQSCKTPRNTQIHTDTRED